MPSLPWAWLTRFTLRDRSGVPSMRASTRWNASRAVSNRCAECSTTSCRTKIAYSSIGSMMPPLPFCRGTIVYVRRAAHNPSAPSASRSHTASHCHGSGVWPAERSRSRASGPAVETDGGRLRRRGRRWPSSAPLGASSSDLVKGRLLLPSAEAAQFQQYGPQLTGERSCVLALGVRELDSERVADGDEGGQFVVRGDSGG